MAALTSGIAAVAIACGGEDATATSQPASGPTATAIQPQVTSTLIAPTQVPPGSTPTSTPRPTPTEEIYGTIPAPVPTAVPTPFPTFPPTPEYTEAPLDTPTPGVPTATPTQAPPTATPVVIFTPGVTNTVEIVASKDNTLYESSVGGISNGAGEGLFVGRTNMNQRRRALVWFDVAKFVPTGATIESVELTLSVTKTATQIQPVTVHRLTADWGEGTSNANANEGQGITAAPGDATWTHAFSPDVPWQIRGGDSISTPSAEIPVHLIADYTWSTPGLVADVQAWVNDPSTNAGWMLRGDETEQKSAKRFASREHTNADLRPSLVIRFTP